MDIEGFDVVQRTGEKFLGYESATIVGVYLIGWRKVFAWIYRWSLRGRRLVGSI